MGKLLRFQTKAEREELKGGLILVEKGEGVQHPHTVNIGDDLIKFMEGLRGMFSEDALEELRKELEVEGEELEAELGKVDG